MNIPIISGIECVRIIGKEKGLEENIDNIDTTEHYFRYLEDFQIAKDLGISILRVGIPWHKIEKEKGKYDWEWCDKYIQSLKDFSIDPIVDPLHHVSIPSWLYGGFLDESFVFSYCKFFTLLVNRYPHISKYTIVNEPTVTTYFAVDAGIWYPFEIGKFNEGLENIFQIIKNCAIFLKENNKEHYYIDPSEYHYGTCENSCTHAKFKNEWRFRLLDRLVSEKVPIDVLGLDYYSHNEFEWGNKCRMETSSPIGFYKVAKQYWERYKIPLALTETNIRGFITDRQTWFVHMYKECEKLRKNEIPLLFFCWYPLIDSTDWCSLVTSCNRKIDPQGIILLNDNFDRVQNEFSESIKGLNKGTISIRDVKEYPYQPPLDENLKGFLKFNLLD